MRVAFTGSGDVVAAAAGRRAPWLSGTEMETADPQPPPQHRSPLPIAPPWSEDRHVRLLENLQIGIVVQGPGAEIHFANRAALEMLGLDAPDVIGRTSIAI